MSLLGNYCSTDENKQVCGQNENFNATKKLLLRNDMFDNEDTSHFWMHLLPTDNEYHSLDIIFLVIFLDFSQFTLV